MAYEKYSADKYPSACELCIELRSRFVTTLIWREVSQCRECYARHMKRYWSNSVTRQREQLTIEIMREYAEDAYEECTECMEKWLAGCSSMCDGQTNSCTREWGGGCSKQTYKYGSWGKTTEFALTKRQYLINWHRKEWKILRTKDIGLELLLQIKAEPKIREWKKMDQERRKKEEHQRFEKAERKKKGIEKRNRKVCRKAFKNKMKKIGEWRARKHKMYPECIRNAMRTLVLLAKMYTI